MIQTSTEIGEIATALVKAQAEIENVEATGKNPAFKRDGKESRYATLGGVLDEVRPKLAKHGVSILQMPINGEGSNIGVVTRLLHSSGQWIESALYVAPAQFTAQGAGSVISYLRRYSLMAMTGIAPEDDDGNAASVSAPAPQRAGMVRAADVPPVSNGKAKTEHPRRQEALDAWKRIHDELTNAPSKVVVDNIMASKLTRDDLLLIKQINVETYDQLVRLANTRTMEFVGATG